MTLLDDNHAFMLPKAFKDIKNFQFDKCWNFKDGNVLIKELTY